MQPQTRTPWLRRMLKPLLLLAALVAVAVTVLQCSRTDPPPPAWTEADLPTVALGNNGWVVANEAAVVSAELDSVSSLQSLMQALRGPEAQLERAVVWATVGNVEAELEVVLEEPPGADLLAAWHRAAAARQYADGCPLTIERDCNHVGLLSLHRLALVEALHRGAQGDWDAGLRISADLVRMSGEYLATAHGVLAGVVAVRAVHEALTVADLMLWKHDVRTHGGLAQRTALRAAIDAMGTDHRVLRHTVIGEYLVARTMVDAMSQEATATQLFDRGATLASVDRIFEALMRSVVSDGVQFERPQSDCNHWKGKVFNSTGCMVLELLPGPEMIASRLTGVRDELDAIDQRRRALLARTEPTP
ncbi:MAG: hypothetical protein K0V04_40985 [Deltaproteobacteria bacterium]|nr:hypothetical protein [Deltaproteobacteria bacterium]